MESSILTSLQGLRTYFESGATLSYAFRRKQLLLLKETLLQHETELHKALYADLKKSPEESWVTETGFLRSGINHILKHLHRWMKREKVPTNLLNLPGRSYIYKEPLGIVLIIAPWNYPLQLLLMPLAGAIAAGNCVVLKPSEHAPATASVMRKIITQIYPPHYVLYVEGDGATIVPHILSHFRFDHIFYTGSTEVGRKIYETAAKALVPVTLELGGKSPCVIEADANSKVAAKRIAMTKFSNAGQMCVAPDYILVHQLVKEKFMHNLKEAIQQFFSADPASSYDYGKIVNYKQFNRLVNYMKEGTIVYGGQWDTATHYISPTVLENVPLDATVMGEEIFGPVLPVIPFTTFEEAKEIINRNPNPLAFYVFTESPEKEKRWLREISFGGGCVNNVSFHFTNHNLPFGGKGNSGIGAYHGRFSFDIFTHKKGILKTPTWFNPAIKYPSFKGKLDLLKKLIR